MVLCKSFYITWLLFLWTAAGQLIGFACGAGDLFGQKGLTRTNGHSIRLDNPDLKDALARETLITEDQKSENDHVIRAESRLRVEKLFNISNVLSNLPSKRKGSQTDPTHVITIKTLQAQSKMETPKKSSYHFSGRFARRKLLSIDQKTYSKSSMKIGRKRVFRASGKATGPGDFVTNWPATNNQIQALKTKLDSSRKVLDQTEESLLEKIDEGDALRKQASRVTNIQRLNQFGKTSDRKKVERLENAYKGLNDAIKNLEKTVDTEEKELGENILETKVQALERELRKQMDFEGPNVDKALKSGWSTMTNSLADTTNFQYSALQENRGPPVVPIYRYGDGPGETTYLDEELRNMQQSIDSLSGGSIDTTDPDLQRVDEVLHDFLRHESDRVISVADAEAANAVGDFEEKIEPSDDENGDTSDLENMTNDIDDGTSTMSDGVFYLQDQSSKVVGPASSASDLEEQKETSEAGSVSDNTVGADTNAAGKSVQLDAGGEDSGSDEDDNVSAGDNGDNENSEVKDGSIASEQTDKGDDETIDGNEDIGSDGYVVDSIRQGHHRESRSVYLQPKVPVEKHSIDDESDVNDSNSEANKKGGVNTAVNKIPMDGDSPSPRVEEENSKGVSADDEEERLRDKPEQGEEEYEIDDDDGETDNDNIKHRDENLFTGNNEAYTEDKADTDSDEEEDEAHTVLQGDDGEDFDNIEDVEANKDKNPMETRARILNLVMSGATLAEDEKSAHAGSGGDGGELAVGSPAAPGEVTDVDDSPLYRPDPEFPVTEATSRDGVGSLAYWQNELDGLEEAERRNARLVEELQRDMFGYAYGNHHRSGDMLFIEAAQDAELAEKNPANGGGKSPRVSDLLSEQVQKIIEETRENEGKNMLPGRKILQPWRQTLDFDVDPSAGDGSSRLGEKDLESLVNPDLGDMIRKAERNYRRGGYWRHSDKPLDRLDLVDDLPIDPKEFDYLHQLSDVSWLTKPVEVRQVKLKKHGPRDRRTEAALKRLDGVVNTLKQTKEDIKRRRRQLLKKKLANLENLRRDAKVQRETDRMENMYQDIKEISNLDAKTKELRQERVKQYEDMHKELAEAYENRQEWRKKNYIRYGKLLKQIDKNKEVLDGAMYEPPPWFPVHTYPKPRHPKRLMKRIKWQ